MGVELKYGMRKTVFFPVISCMFTHGKQNSLIKWGAGLNSPTGLKIKNVLTFIKIHHFKSHICLHCIIKYQTYLAKPSRLARLFEKCQNLFSQVKFISMFYSQYKFLILFTDNSDVWLKEKKTIYTLITKILNQFSSQRAYFWQSGGGHLSQTSKYPPFSTGQFHSLNIRNGRD